MIFLYKSKATSKTRYNHVTPVILSFFIALTFQWTEHVIAAPNIIIPLDRPSDKKLQLKPTPKFTKPPIIDLPPFDLDQPDNPSIKDLLNFVARKFRFEGNTIFSDQELAKLIDKFRMTPINALDLEELRLLITKHYTDRGYINSGALFPDQNLLGGLLIINITEGVLQDIRIENSGRLTLDYIHDRLRFRADEPLKLEKLQTKLRLLQQNPRIERLNATLMPGNSLGTSILDIKVTEANPLTINIEANNYRPPSIGKGQSILYVQHNNVSGIGDSIDANLIYTKGSRTGSIEYTYPISHFESEFYVGANHYDMKITQEPFNEVGVRARGYAIQTGIKSPIIRRKQERYDIDFKFEYKSNVSAFNNDTCWTNPNDETTNIAAIRIGQSLLEKSKMDVFYLRHTINVGINAFNATSCPSFNPAMPNEADSADSQFTSWLWQVLWSHKFKLYKIQSIFRSSFQIAQRPLLSSEKYGIGGANSVRGFQENMQIRDNGRFFSLEARLPLRTRAFPKLEMQALVFSDYGTAWNVIDNYSGRITISSIGIGYRWRYPSVFQAELFFAEPLKISNEDPSGRNLQTQEIHARIRYDFF